MPITIRPATFDDEQAVLDLIEQLFDPPGGRPPEYSRQRGRTGFRWAVSEPHADVLVALDGERLVGLSSVYQDIQSIRFGPRCWLKDLVVRNDRRGQGIGGQLLQASGLVGAWAGLHPPGAGVGGGALRCAPLLRIARDDAVDELHALAGLTPYDASLTRAFSFA